MSNILGYGLRTRKAEDFEQMAAYATKLTREWSQKELGYDMTLRDEEREKERGFYYQGFDVEGHQVMWNDFSGSRKNIPVGDIIEEVSKHFPEMELLFWRSWEGPIDYECIIKNGVETEIKPYSLCVYIEDEEYYNRLADLVQKKELQAPNFIEKVIVKEDQRIALLYFESLTKEGLESVKSVIMNEITKLLPLADFYCLLIGNNEMGDRIERKAHVSNGKTEWQDVPKEEDSPVYYQDYDKDNPFVEEITTKVFMSIYNNHKVSDDTKGVEDNVMKMPSAMEAEKDDFLYLFP